MENLYKQAAVEQWRFNSIKGQITVEDLWAIPLDDSETKISGFSLDSVAVALDEEIQKEISDFKMMDVICIDDCFDPAKSLLWKGESKNFIISEWDCSTSI